MNSLQKKLIGGLIGLARATDGNEHLITPAFTDVVIECLSSLESEDAVLQSLLKRVEQAKRHMVPNCFLCANPCGRTSDFDLDELQKTSSEIRELKLQILSALRTLVRSGCAGYDPRILYQGLVVIGMEDYEAEDLVSVLKKLESQMLP